MTPSAFKTALSVFQVQVGDNVEVHFGASLIVLGKIHRDHGNDYFLVETHDHSWLIDMESVTAIKFARKQE